jgi:hypothetical protein
MRTAAIGTALALTPIATLLGGCGSQTKTVDVKTPAQHHEASAQRRSTTSSTTTTTSAPTVAETSESTATAQTTEETTSSRTSAAPAFLGHAKSGNAALAAAVAAVEGQGYTPTSTAEYHPSQTLTVMTASHEGAGQQAFFFVDGKYIGTDASQPSASIAVVSQADTEVVLSYALYNAGEQPDGHAQVRFQLNNGKLMPLSAIPPVKPSASAAGRL